MTKILTCTCLHDFQDSRYGFLKRVHNFARKAFAGDGGWRCTVCLNEKRRDGERQLAAEAPDD